MTQKRAKLQMIESPRKEARSYDRTPAQPAIPPIIHFALQSVKRRFWLIAQIAFCGLLLTLAYLFLITPQYTATASLLLDTRQKKIFNADVVLPGLESDVYIIESQLEILRSDRILARVLAQLRPDDLVAVLGLRGGQSASAGARAAPKPATSGDQEDRAKAPKSRDLEALGRRLRVARKGRSYVVDIAFTDVSPVRAARIANLYVDAFISDQVDSKVQATRSANEWLLERLKELGRDVEEAERRLQLFREQNDLVDVGDKSLIQKEISDFSLQLMTARARAAEAEAQLAQVRGLASKPNQLQAIESALQSTVIGDFRRQQSQVQRRISELISRYGANHPSVVNAQAELETLNKGIEGEVNRIMEGAQRTYEAQQEKIRLLEEGYADLKARSMKRGEHQIKLNSLLRELEAASSLMTNLQRRFKETQAQEKLQTADARVVAYAAQPETASFPKKTPILALSAFLWLALGAGIAIARDLTRLRYLSEYDAETALRLPCIASFKLPQPEETETGDSLSLNVSGAGDAMLGQASFALKTWVESSAGQRSKVVLVLSPGTSEGRSFVAYQLAYHAAATGSSTLLIDADLTSATLTQLLESKDLATLNSCLANPSLPIARLPDTSLHFCPAETAGEGRPIDVLSSRKMKTFLDRAREKFDLVVIDGSAVSESGDAAALLQRADAVAVVFRSGESAHSDMHDIVRMAERAEVPALGLVMTSAASGSPSATAGGWQEGAAGQRYWQWMRSRLRPFIA